MHRLEVRNAEVTTALKHEEEKGRKLAKDLEEANQVSCYGPPTRDGFRFNWGRLVVKSLEITVSLVQDDIKCQYAEFMPAMFF